MTQANLLNEYIYIGIGSNIEPEINIPKSLYLLKKHLIINNISPIFITQPIGGKEKQPDFFNGVIETELKKEITPFELKFNILKDIEKQLKRIHSIDKYAPRTIDLDILLFKNVIENTENLVIPDTDIFLRDFLFAGLLYLNPNLIIYPKNIPLLSFVSEYKIDKLKINCNFTEKLWKEFLNEY
ncbi:MAG: 2-amino-4-hydroxy-6-hydroxymethyldihydropteridine diphosphokinase [Candidatus Hydrogenedens sp.]